MTKTGKTGRPPAGGVVVQIRLPAELKQTVAIGAEALDTTMSNLVAVCLARTQREEGLGMAYVRELETRAAQIQK